MNRLLIVPKELTTGPFEQKYLKFNEVTVVESCTYATMKTGTMFLEEHLLFCILKGTFQIEHEDQKYFLKKNEMVILKKAISIEFTKSGDPDDDNIFEIMMFFLKDEFLKKFVHRIGPSPKPKDDLIPVSVKSIDKRLLGFIESLKPYLNEIQSINKDLVMLKMFELLYDIGNIDSDLLSQILQLNQQTRNNIRHVVETNFTNPVSLSDLAYLSGRSLSTFKRDFQTIFNIPPSQWIRERRFEEAMKLLISTDMSITDICFSTGFENVSHFSRSFKEHYGSPPSSFRNIKTKK